MAHCNPGTEMVTYPWLRRPRRSARRAVDAERTGTVAKVTETTEPLRETVGQRFTAKTIRLLLYLRKL